jgi:putative ABC transport system substrate-binding protein
MNRRRFLLTSLAGALAAPLTAEAQQAGKLPTIGVLASSRLTESLQGQIRDGLKEHGYVEGRNIVIEWRAAEDRNDRAAALATELARLRVDVIVAHLTPVVQAAKKATSTIPIVMAFVIDPVGSGFVRSLAHPEGNITGTSIMAPDLVGKQLELLKQVVPTASRVALLSNPAKAGSAPQLQAAEMAARALGVRLQPLEARSLGEIDRAFAAMTKERADALLVLLDPVLAVQRERIADLTARTACQRYTGFGCTPRPGASCPMARTLVTCSAA